MLKLCVAGAAGKMGSTVIREAVAKGHQIIGAIEAPNNPCIGKSLRELGICDSDTRIVGSDRISEAARDADVYVTFTMPAAEVQNIPAGQKPCIPDDLCGAAASFEQKTVTREVWVA